MGRKKKVDEVKTSKTGDKSLELIKTKLRKKYFLLRNDALDYDSRADLLNHVCKVTGMGTPELDVVLADL